MMVSSGTLWAVKSTAHSLTSQPSSAAAARLLMARTKPRLAYQPSSNGTFSPPAASSASRLTSDKYREAIGHGGLGVQEAAAHADGEGELLDEARLQGERLARRDVGQGRSAADKLVARLHDLEGLRVRGAPGHALQEVGDLLRAARSAEGEQGDVDGALGHGGRPFQMGVADRRCTASTRYLTLSGGVCGMRP